ncbi:MAG: hypothetical protein EOM90_04695 [Alphaproteobacteria bacterium]|nr:hypothetical protein [Alphaproteobacteria bacterium]
MSDIKEKLNFLSDEEVQGIASDIITKLDGLMYNDAKKVISLAEQMLDYSKIDVSAVVIKTAVEA